MKVPLNWLAAHLESDAPQEAIVKALSSLGLVVDGVLSPGKIYKGFIIAQIVGAEKHPQADRLQVCDVDTGTARLQIVCGAPNARAGIKVILAQEGAVVPANGMVIGRAKMRGVESCGMLCSSAELGLPDAGPEGIFEVEDDVALGTPLAVYLGLEADVLDVDVTPNRGDCFSMRGIARDLAAKGLGGLAHLSIQCVPVTHADALPVSIEEAAKDMCPHFTGRVIRGVKNGPSPLWLKKLLRAAGQRSISALVDVTNYMAMDLGRPMHVFDARKIPQGLQVRPSKADESFEALDGQTYTLPAGLLVIASGDEVTSLAGVMGGMKSSCDLETVDVFLESAYFTPATIAKSGQATGILSESRSRFERGTDPSLVLMGLERATRLIVELCGGEAGPVVTCGAPAQIAHTITLHPSHIMKRLGWMPDYDVYHRILEGLGCMVTPLDEDAVCVLTPSWRHDLAGEDDLVEEIARVVGYDQIPSVALPHGNAALEAFESAPGAHTRARREWIARRALAARHMAEVVTYSFVSESQATLFAEGASLLTLDNPISQELNTMRPRLLPSLIVSVKRNVAKGQADVSLFEVASHYGGAHPSAQRRMVAGVRLGATHPRHWREAPQVFTWAHVKDDAFALLDACGVDTRDVGISRDVPSFYHPGRSATLMLGGQVIGVFGQLHPEMLRALDAPMTLVAFEVFLDALPEMKGANAPAAISSLQSVERDLAFVMDARVEAARVIAAVYKTDALIGDVRVFDVYQGPHVGDGKKSLAITYRMDPVTQTLTDAQIHDIMNRVIAHVEKETGGVLRA
ncbi:MAG: phenylalanine--tRNA ligase subunit beta [Proteobacteria bacterium]|nr:phenylalanine--tRNA ligase subunit beta [Pseudomonadota bacterium]